MKKPVASGGGPVGAAPVRDSTGVQQLRAAIRASDAGMNAKRAEQQQIQNNVRLYQERISSSPLVEEAVQIS